MSQFRLLNKPTLTDRWHNFVLHLQHRHLNKTVFCERGAQLYRFAKNIRLDDSVYLKRNSIVGAASPNARVSVGRNTTIGFNSIIMASQKIEISDNVMIAPNVYIVDSNHGTNHLKPFNEQDNISSPIQIGSNVWIGAGAIILAGVKIPDNTIIGAGALVNKPIENSGIYVGMPAKRMIQ